MFFSTEEIDRLIKEDVPYIDLTSHSLGISNEIGKIIYFTREDCTICGTEEVRQIFNRLDIKTDLYIPSGTRVKAGDEVISGIGTGANLHIAWKVGQNILDHLSGIATKTNKMMSIVKEYSSDVALLTTRKGFPGTKSLSIKAIMAGGAMPHRLGISETILIFKQHINFIGGFDILLKKIPNLKVESCEKKIIVEAVNFEETKQLCEAGVDGIQFDKLDPENIKKIIAELKSFFPNVIFLASGGVREANIDKYVQTGVNGIVTTDLYNAIPIDIGVKMELL